MVDAIVATALARAVGAVLAGTTLRDAAASAGIAPAELGAAVAAYQAAGDAALRAHLTSPTWWQATIRFPDWGAAERIAVDHLRPPLQRAEDTGGLTRWWFIRKAPCWRLRCQPDPTAPATGLRETLSTVLDGLTAAGLIERWHRTIYEPETHAFGGPDGMDIAHRLFHADSRGILDHLRRQDLAPAPPIGRRELSILLCNTLFRAAGQEWHERGDIWDRISQLRPPPPDITDTQLHTMSAGLRLLMATRTDSTLFRRGPLSSVTPWAAGFAAAGQQLGQAARAGTLQRGIRDILAHHVIFHWNRLGIDITTQSVLARAARDTVMKPV